MLLAFVLGPSPEQDRAVLTDGEDPPISFAEESRDDLFMIPRESERQIVLNLVQGHLLDGQVIAPGDEEAAVRSPSDACDVGAVQVAILLVEHQRREDFLRDSWCFENLELLSGRHGEEFGIW